MVIVGNLFFWLVGVEGLWLAIRFHLAREMNAWLKSDLRIASMLLHCGARKGSEVAWLMDPNPNRLDG